MRLINADALILRAKSPIEHGEGVDDPIYGLDTFDLEEILELAPTVMQWVSAEDRMPSLGSFVLAHFNNGRVKIMQCACISEQFVGEGDAVCQKCFMVHRKDNEHYITHWMPLPPSPNYIND